MTSKELVGAEIAKRVQSGQTIGVGTGSTVDAALVAIGERVRSEGLQVQVVTTSLESAWKCEDVGLIVLSSGYRGQLDWSFDGADAVDERMRAIKGKGGAMLQEKILAARCSRYTLIIDESKFTSNIAAVSAVPIEVLPAAIEIVKRELLAWQPLSVQLRQAQAKHGPVITEAGNVILDVRFSSIADEDEIRLKGIVGVAETGLFLHYAQEVLIGASDGVRCIGSSL